MPMAGFIIDGADVPYAEALDMAACGALPYPPALLRALFNGRQDDVPTASALGGCLREWEWKRKHDYYEAPERLLAALFGTGVHGVLERSADGGQQEKKLRREIALPPDLAPYDKPTVSGTVDHIDTASGVVLDWKSKKYLPKRDFKPTPRHIIQVHVYAWLAAGQPDAAPLTRWQIVYLDQSNVQTFSGALRPLDDVEAWIRDRLAEWAAARLTGDLPAPCAERWCSVCRAGL